jgi:hypothetical protein
VATFMSIMSLPEFLVVYNVFTCVVVIFLGFFQKRHLDSFSKWAIVFAILNAMCAVLLYSGTEFFPAAVSGVAANLLIHSAMIHFPLMGECQESFVSSCPAFRCRCVCNHETWVLVAVTAGLVSALEM